MAKLVDALDLGSSGATHRSSSLLTRTTNFTYWLCQLGKLSVQNAKLMQADKNSGRMTHSMADIAQLVRALVCGTKCRRFESGYPPHHKKAPQRGVFL